MYLCEIRVLGFYSCAQGALKLVFFIIMRVFGDFL